MIKVTIKVDDEDLERVVQSARKYQETFPVQAKDHTALGRIQDAFTEALEKACGIEQPRR
ncbi:MAG: hypothetical protein JWO67_2222 [Streptosporangiaceae bacterium]|nr:hypothetical protein [Streptosporangiaceae bacterium]